MASSGTPNSLIVHSVGCVKGYANTFTSSVTNVGTLTSSYSSFTNAWAETMTITSIDVTNLTAANLVIPTYSQDIIVANETFFTVSSIGTISFSLTSGLIGSVSTIASSLFVGTNATLGYLFCSVSTVNTLTAPTLFVGSQTTGYLFSSVSTVNTLTIQNVVTVQNNLFAQYGTLNTLNVSISTINTLSVPNVLLGKNATMSYVYSSVSTLGTLSFANAVGTSQTAGYLFSSISTVNTLSVPNSLVFSGTMIGGSGTVSYLFASVSTVNTLSVPSVMLGKNATLSYVYSSVSTLGTLSFVTMIGTNATLAYLFSSVSTINTLSVPSVLLGGNATLSYLYSSVSTIGTLSFVNMIGTNATLAYLFASVSTVATMTTQFLMSTIATIGTLTGTRVTVSSAFIGTLSVSTMLAPAGAINTTSGNIQNFNSSVSFAQTMTARKLFASYFDNVGTFYGIMYPMYMNQNVFIENLNSHTVGFGYTISQYTTQFSGCWFEFKDMIAIKNTNVPATWTLGLPNLATLTLFLRGAKNSVPFTLTLAEVDATAAASAYGTDTLSTDSVFLTNLFTRSTRYWVGFDNNSTLDLILATKTLSGGESVTSSRGVLQFRMTIEFGDIALNGGNPWG